MGRVCRWVIARTVHRRSDEHPGSNDLAGHGTALNVPACVCGVCVTIVGGEPSIKPQVNLNLKLAAVIEKQQKRQTSITNQAQHTYLACPCPMASPKRAPQAWLPSTAQSPASCASHSSQSWPHSQMPGWHCQQTQACTCHTRAQPPCVVQCERRSAKCSSARHSTER